MKKIIMVLSLCLAGCASIVSNRVTDEALVKGLIYYMPKKNFIVTITVKLNEKKQKEIEKVEIQASASYPDLSEKYVLNMGRNLVGNSTLNVTINAAGLLSTIKSKTESKITETLQNAAKSTAGIDAHFMYVNGPGKNLDTDKIDCQVGEQKFMYEGPTLKKKCGMWISIKKLNAGAGKRTKNKPETANSSWFKRKSVAGVYYRQNEPYLVSVKGQGVHAVKILLSPSESKTYFLPVAKSLFVDNETDLTFDQGVPTVYNQVRGGELVAMLKLPADVLGSYFGAIGEMFPKFSKANDDRVKLMESRIKLELARTRYANCLAAIQAKNEELIKQLQCNKK